MKKIKNVGLLILTATLWGVAFVAQDVGLEHIGPFTFSATRSFLGAVALFVISVFADSIKRKKTQTTISKEEKKVRIKSFLKAGLICGVVFFAATNTQQFGLLYTTAGKSGFITACYIVLVPIIGLFFGRKCPVYIWVSVIATIVGLYMLCMGDGFTSLNKGDVITLACAVLFAVHIIVIDKFANKVDGIKLACAQCTVNAVLSGICMFIFESPNITYILKAWIPIVYAGVFSSGLAYMFQILGQKDFNPTIASLVMSLESVISVIAAWIILNQQLSEKEIIGCVIIFSAIIFAQIPFRRKNKTIKTLY